MYEPEKLLENLDLERLSAEQAIQEIQKLSDNVLPDMSPGYYQKRLGAISILAQVAAVKMS